MGWRRLGRANGRGIRKTARSSGCSGAAGTSTLEERMRSSQFESLRVSRSRIMTQLNGATNPAHRTMLERALKSINDQMAKDEANS